MKPESHPKRVKNPPAFHVRSCVCVCVCVFFWSHFLGKSGSTNNPKKREGVFFWSVFYFLGGVCGKQKGFQTSKSFCRRDFLKLGIFASEPGSRKKGEGTIEGRSQLGVFFLLIEKGVFFLRG